MDGKVNVGVVGCGAFASGTLVPNVVKNPNLHLRALNRRNEERLAMLNKEFSPDYITTDMEEVFKDPEIQMVICGTKPHFRIPIMELAVKYGKDLFVEKPLCYDENDVEPMVKLISHSDIKFMVGFNRPYSHMMQDIKPLLHQYKKDNVTIVYRIIGEGFLWPKSHKDAVMVRKESTLIHEITHIFDLLNWLTDLMPTRVYTAGGGNVDNIVTLNYPDDITAVIIAGDNSTAGYPKERIEINANYGTIVGDHFVELTVAGFDMVHYRRTYDYAMAGKTYNTNGREAEEKQWEWRNSVTQEEMDYGYYYDRQLKCDKGHYGELEHFRQCILKDEPSQTGVVRGALATLTALRAMESWEKGQAVDLDFAYLYEI